MSCRADSMSTICARRHQMRALSAVHGRARQQGSVAAHITLAEQRRVQGLPVCERMRQSHAAESDAVAHELDLAPQETASTFWKRCVELCFGAVVGTGTRITGCAKLRRLVAPKHGEQVTIHSCGHAVTEQQQPPSTQAFVHLRGPQVCVAAGPALAVGQPVDAVIKGAIATETKVHGCVRLATQPPVAARKVGRTDVACSARRYLNATRRWLVADSQPHRSAADQLVLHALMQTAKVGRRRLVPRFLVEEVVEQRKLVPASKPGLPRRVPQAWRQRGPSQLHDQPSGNSHGHSPALSAKHRARECARVGAIAVIADVRARAQ
eukprot:7201900-Prymnesium_polylepis.2